MRILPRLHRSLSTWRVRHVANHRAAPLSADYKSSTGYPVINHHNHRLANDRIKQWPEYTVTPLVKLSDDFAKRAGVHSLHAKIEGNRCGLSSFKALGGGYAVDTLRSGNCDREIVIATASAGNHGISRAWGARRIGARCVVYVHEGVGDGARAAMESLGAEVRVCDGNYSDSVDQCRNEAAKEGFQVVQDVSSEDYVEIPRLIWQGYTTVASEICAQLEEEAVQPPTHVLVNAGVGGLACAMTGHLWEEYGDKRPRLVCVEPLSAACLSLSCEQGFASTVVASDKDGGTIQTGLDCASAAPLAWEVLNEGANDFVSIGDECVAPTMRMLAKEGIVGGTSSVAGLGVVMAAGKDRDLAARLGLGPDSRVVVIICEGAVDKLLYENMVKSISVRNNQVFNQVRN